MTDRSIRVLLVEDQIEFADLLREILVQVSSAQFEVIQARQFSEVREQLRVKAPDVILLDLTLPDRHGLATYTDLKLVSPRVPVIILTGFDDERLAAQAVRAGAQDYLVKGQFD